MYRLLWPQNTLWTAKPDAFPAQLSRFGQHIHWHKLQAWGPKDQLLKPGCWQLSRDCEDGNGHSDLSLLEGMTLESHTTRGSKRTAQLEKTTFSGSNFVNSEQSHGIWVRRADDALDSEPNFPTRLGNKRLWKTWTIHCPLENSEMWH